MKSLQETVTVIRNVIPKINIFLKASIFSFHILGLKDLSLFVPQII